jgi:hypothetical protein
VVAVDLFTKWVEARALTEADAQSIATFLHEDIFCRHGVPTRLTSDQGSEFVNELIAVLTRNFGIRHIRTTPYHPQANGQVERTNQTLKNLLAKLAKDQLGKWDHYLSNALFVIRTMKQASTRFSPSDLLYGRQLCDGHTSWEPSNDLEDRDNLDYLLMDVKRLQQIRQEAHKFITRAQAKQKESFDQRQDETETFRIGDQVLLYRDIIETSWSAKLELRWEGPFYVQRIKGTTHWLRKNDGTILAKGVHRNRLKRYHARK